MMSSWKVEGMCKRSNVLSYHYESNVHVQESNVHVQEWYVHVQEWYEGNVHVYESNVHVQEAYASYDTQASCMYISSIRFCI